MIFPISSILEGVLADRLELRTITFETLILLDSCYMSHKYDTFLTIILVPCNNSWSGG